MQIYSPGATTRGTTLSFDNTQSGTGGTLDLMGSSTTLGAISSVAAGSGVITNSGRTQNSPSLPITPATLTVDFDTVTSAFSGILQDGAGGLSLVKNGTGTLTLGGANTYTGATTINAGTLHLAHQNALQHSTAVLAGGALTFDAAATAYNLGGLSGSGTVTLSNSATVPQPVALTVGSNGASTLFSGSLTGSGSLTKAGSGTLTLSGANSYLGSLTVAAGTLYLAQAASLPVTSSPSVQSGATAAFNVGGTGEFAITSLPVLAGSASFQSGSSIGVDTTNAPSPVTITTPFISPNGGTTPLGFIKLGSGTLALGANNGIGSSFTLAVASGTLNIASFNNTVAGLQLTGGTVTGTTGLLTSASAIDARSGDASASLTGSVGLNKTTTGTVTLSGANTYSGVTTISGGILQFGRPAALYNSSTTVLGAGVTATNLVVQSGTTAAFNFGGSGDFTQAEIDALAALGGFQSGSSLGLDTSNAAGSVVLTTPLIGPNSGATATILTKLGAGTLAMGATNVIGSSFTVAVSSGTFDLSTFSNAVAGLQLTGGTVTGTTGSLTSTSAFDLRSGTASGTLAGAVALNKSTTGTVTLSGTNTYTGGTNLNAGILNVTSAGAFGTTGAISFNGGTLQYGSGNTTDYSARFSNAASQQYLVDTNGQNVTLAATLTSASGTFTKLGAGALTVSGSLRQTGATSVLGGTLVVNGSIGGTTEATASPGVTVGDGVNPATLTGTGGILLGNSKTVVVKNGATLAPGINGIGALSILTGQNTETAASATAGLELQSGSTLQLSVGSSQTHGTVALQNFVTATLAGILDIHVASQITNGDVFPILTDTAGFAGLFSNANGSSGTYLGGSTYFFTSEGLNWDINYAWNSATAQSGVSYSTFEGVTNGSDIALLAVPEPGVLVSLLGGVGILVGWRRRRG
jgi:autotransporter-associated beta strand protein